jgi:prephenate dehydratase
MSTVTKVAIQGGPASFHDVAARQYFAGTPVETVPCVSFKELCHKLAAEEVDYAVMAIENTLAGSILTNYSLLHQNNFSIIGEMYHHIRQNLMALPGQKLEDITVVRSHPMALLQCIEFLHEHPHMQPIEADDTAESARKISEEEAKGVAAIASEKAAERYGLEILQGGIEDMKENFTRFLVLSRENEAKFLSCNKASLILRLSHAPGALANVLAEVAERGVNISLIQSIPIPSRATEFDILIDLEASESKVLRETVEALDPFVKSIKKLGLYRS